MGASGSKVEKALGTSFPLDEKFFGFQNFGNTCYCNSVLQTLYFCRPFRKHILEYNQQVVKPADGKAGAAAAEVRDTRITGKSADPHILTALARLFDEIANHKTRTGVVAPHNFIMKLRENELFRSAIHHDAHEFLNFMLNEIHEILLREQRTSPNADGVAESFVREVFGGILTNETKCVCCETVSSRDEPFLDLSLDVEQHTSVSSCLKNFSATERLCRNDKFYCEKCCSLQEAEKCMRIKQAPQVLLLHLKRFKYVEELQRHKKLCYRVVFPMELRLRNMSSTSAADVDREYTLSAVVIHIGGGPSSGHYVAMVKSHSHWLLFDDDDVEVISEQHIQRCFGSHLSSAATDVGYILFYEAKSISSSQPNTPPLTSTTGTPVPPHSALTEAHPTAAVGATTAAATVGGYLPASPSNMHL